MTEKKSLYKPFYIGVACILFLFPVVSHGGMTEVSNSISVSAQGGTSKASVTSIINGVIVEDVAITAPKGETIQYVSSTSAGINGTSTPHIQNASTTKELRETLNQLLSLLTYYVSLLTT